MVPSICNVSRTVHHSSRNVRNLEKEMKEWNDNKIKEVAACAEEEISMQLSSAVAIICYKNC